MAKVIFLHLFVILFTGGVGGIPEGTEADPPGPDTPPEQTPPGPDPPQTRPPRDQPPPGPDPPGADNPPPEQTLAYGLRAAGTHSTGMHSCIRKYDFYANGSVSHLKFSSEFGSLTK